MKREVSTPASTLSHMRDQVNASHVTIQMEKMTILGLIGSSPSVRLRRTEESLQLGKNNGCIVFPIKQNIHGRLEEGVPE